MNHDLRAKINEYLIYILPHNIDLLHLHSLVTLFKDNNVEVYFEIKDGACMLEHQIAAFATSMVVKVLPLRLKYFIHVNIEQTYVYYLPVRFCENTNGVSVASIF